MGITVITETRPNKGKGKRYVVSKDIDGIGMSRKFPFTDSGFEEAQRCYDKWHKESIGHQAENRIYKDNNMVAGLSIEYGRMPRGPMFKVQLRRKGERATKAFTIKTYGFDNAYWMAVKWILKYDNVDLNAKRSVYCHRALLLYLAKFEEMMERHDNEASS